MVSDFIKKKLVHAFNQFFDIDNSGYIDIKDFNVFIIQVVKYLDLKPGDAKYKELKDQWHEVWEGMIKDIDVDGDGELCLAEWIAYWNRMAKDPTMNPEWFDLFLKTGFDLQSDPETGKVTLETHVKSLSVYGLDPKEITEAFKKSSGGKSGIDLNEFKHLWREYFTSDDPNAFGNYIAGKVNF